MPGDWQLGELTGPLSYQAGDVIEHVAGVVYVRRAGVIVGQRDIASLFPAGPFAATEGGTLDQVYLWKEKKMPGVSVAMTKVETNESTGSVTFSFSDGENIEYESWNDAGLATQDVDATGATARKCLVRKAYLRSTDGTNKSNMVGGAVAINMLADQPFELTYPE